MTSLDENSVLIRDAQSDAALRRVATDLELVGRTRTGSVVLRGRSTATSETIIVKLGIQEMERHWMSGLFQHAPDVVPNVFGVGDLNGRTGVGWIATQALPELDPGDRDDARGIARAAARFHEVAPYIDGPRFGVKDAEFFAGVGRRAVAKGLQGANRVVERVESDFAWLADVAEPTLGHGDLSFDNALRRAPDVVLIDPLPSVAPWPFEAAWCEVCSGEPTTSRLVPLLAEARVERGLSSVSGADLDRAEVISLAWASLLSWVIWPRPDDEIWVRTTTNHVAGISEL